MTYKIGEIDISSQAIAFLMFTSQEFTILEAMVQFNWVLWIPAFEIDFYKYNSA